MTKENGGFERRQRDPYDEPVRFGMAPRRPRSAERALTLSATLTAICFLTHILLLLLVDPWFILPISKDAAVVYAGIPLCFAVVFSLLSIYNFTRIEERRVLHILLLLLAIIFGSLSLQGLLGTAMHYYKFGGHD